MQKQSPEAQERDWSKSNIQRLTENFLRLMTDQTKVQKDLQMPRRVNPEKTTWRHMTISLLKTKHTEVLKASRERRQIMFKGTTRLTEAKRQQSIFIMLKESNHQARISYTANISTKNKDEVRAFSGNQNKMRVHKLGECI